MFFLLFRVFYLFVTDISCFVTVDDSLYIYGKMIIVHIDSRFTSHKKKKPFSTTNTCERLNVLSIQRFIIFLVCVYSSCNSF